MCPYPVNKHIFGKAGFGVFDPAESIHNFAAIEFLSQFWDAVIYSWENMKEKREKKFTFQLCCCKHSANTGLKFVLGVSHPYPVAKSLLTLVFLPPLLENFKS